MAHNHRYTCARKRVTDLEMHVFISFVSSNYVDALHRTKNSFPAGISHSASFKHKSIILSPSPPHLNCFELRYICHSIPAYIMDLINWLLICLYNPNGHNYKHSIETFKQMFVNCLGNWEGGRKRCDKLTRYCGTALFLCEFQFCFISRLNWKPCSQHFGYVYILCVCVRVRARSRVPHKVTNRAQMSIVLFHFYMRIRSSVSFMLSNSCNAINITQSSFITTATITTTTQAYCPNSKVSCWCTLATRFNFCSENWNRIIVWFRHKLASVKLRIVVNEILVCLCVL